MAGPQAGVVTGDPAVGEGQAVVCRSTNREERPVDPDLALAAVRIDRPQDRRRCAHLRDREDHRPVAIGARVERGIGRLEFGRDLDVAVADGRVREELDPRSSREEVAPAAGEDERRVRQLGSDVLDGVAERFQVDRCEVDREAIGDHHPLARGLPLALHDALDPALDLDRLEAGPEEACRGTFEEALEHALEAG